MKKLLFISMVACIMLSSCSSGGNGELVGVYTKSWKEPIPYGMVFVKRGSFTMGQNDQDANWSMSGQSKTVSMDPFWMDDTEITNGEYKQFVYWVKDSITREKLADAGLEEYRITEDRKGNVVDPPRLNWNEKIPWSKLDEEAAEAVKQMYYTGEDAIEIGPQTNATILNYKYLWIDYDQAGLKINKFNPQKGGYDRSIEGLGTTKDSADVMIQKDTAYYNEDGTFENKTVYRELKSRSNFISSKIINIYPDTMCWIRDFTYAYNEPYMKMYFAHPGYGEYPVVGVSWEQATAFSYWRTIYYNTYQLASKGGVPVQAYRLPTEAEWEYAARGGRQLAQYPWGGNYVRTTKGCFMANFKPQRGNYTVDGYMIPAKVGSYPPNDFGLYDMAGNVSEWTSSAYHESNYSFVHDMNPNYQYNAKSNDPDVMRRKVIRGGSWKDIAHFLQNSTRTYEYQQEAHSYIGFRCVRSYIGLD